MILLSLGADCAKNIQEIVELGISSGDRIKLFIESITMIQPQFPATCISPQNKNI